MVINTINDKRKRPIEFHVGKVYMILKNDIPKYNLCKKKFYSYAKKKELDFYCKSHKITILLEYKKLEHYNRNPKI